MKPVIGWLQRDLDDEGEPYDERWRFSKEKPYYGEVKKIVYFEIEQDQEED